MQGSIPPETKAFFLSFFAPGERALVERIVADLEALYQGKWSSFEACDVPYHNLEHALHVAEVTLILLAGRERAGVGLSPGLKRLAFVAALFHDTGYLKDRGDSLGTGAKHTFHHVARSRKIARAYLRELGLSTGEQEAVEAMIGLTDLEEENPPPGEVGEGARVVATADLLAQLCAWDYPERLKDLFGEFEEAYRFEGAEDLKRRGVKVFSSVEELRQNSPAFIEDFVLPRFEALGHQEQYAAFFFPLRRNFFLESLAHNLSCLRGRSGVRPPLSAENIPPGLLETPSEVEVIRHFRAGGGLLFVCMTPYLRPLDGKEVLIPLALTVYGKVLAFKTPLVLDEIPEELFGKKAFVPRNVVALPLKSGEREGVLELFDLSF